MQTLTRKQLIKLHSDFDCALWRDQIEYLLKENILEEKIDVSSKLDLLKSKGTKEQKEAVKKLKITFPKSYLELHNESGLKVGDKVRVVRKATTRENGWSNVWASGMDKYIGKVFKIESNEDELGFILKDKILRFFPYFVLEKVEEKYFPYTLEDNLLGKSVISKSKNFRCLVSYQESNGVWTGSMLISYKNLLENYTELDGSPLGKLVEV